MHSSCPLLENFTKLAETFQGFTVCCPFLSSESDSALKKFLEQTSKMTPEERATFLEKDEVRKC